jgi:lysophospholipase L1-like esterase
VPWLRKDLAKNIALSVISTLVMLFLLEMVLRVTAAVPSRSLEYVTASRWDDQPGPLVPHQSLTDSFKRHLPFTVSTNNLGLRGEDAPAGKPEGTTRVLCLGDSYTFGAYVNDAETWPAQLQTVLRERAAIPRLDVINGGISGFTIVDEMAFLREHGLDLEPDVVVLAFVLNDLADLTRKVSSREMLRIAAEEQENSFVAPLKRQLRQTAIYNMLFIARAWFAKSRGTDPTIQEVDIRHLLKPEYDARTLALFDAYRQHLQEMKALLDERHIGLVLMIYPYWEQIAMHEGDQAQQRLVAMARDLQIPVLDLLPAYRQYDPTGRKFSHMPEDHHPSWRGYRRAARELAPIIEAMLGRPSSPAPQPTPASPAAGSASSVPSPS